MQKLTQDYKYKKKDLKKLFSLPQVKIKFKTSDIFDFYN